MRLLSAPSWKCLDCDRRATNGYFCDECPKDRGAGKTLRVRMPLGTRIATVVLGLARICAIGRAAPMR